ncbi:MAG: formate-dependent phosphoribosylglycinamide formyltransferase [Candidatus Nomurabacteria bacterium]|jgi:phosphoribosylglycinamide formyltransferase 2|nr:formate-dependent phosphoribosylglycinamide formyltransferase [Candidatus Nomurabacteria bacterium]
MFGIQKKVLLLGAGELGKEITIELMRLGAYVVAADSYAGAPAAQVAHESKVLSMTDRQCLKALIAEVQPDIIVPEIEAIATDVLLEVEAGGKVSVVPSARAAHLTMNRRGIRELAAQKLGLLTSDYRFASSKKELETALRQLGFPAVVKPIQSSSGKGQSVVHSSNDILNAWKRAKNSARGSATEVIVEKFVNFVYEITLLTVNAMNGLFFLSPIGHKQIDGDYVESWQPQRMQPKAFASAQSIAGEVVRELAATASGASRGYGIFGVELFVDAHNNVFFSEVSPRPHDTGMVTMISQNINEFALHAYAILGLPIPNVELIAPAAASKALIVHGNGSPAAYVMDEVLSPNLGVYFAKNVPANYRIRVFNKPEVIGKRRCGVVLTTGEDVDAALRSADKVAEAVSIVLG